jgi:FkbM family methyltransferase
MFRRLRTDEERARNAPLIDSIRRLLLAQSESIGLIRQTHQQDAMRWVYLVTRYYLGFLFAPLRGKSIILLPVTVNINKTRKEEQLYLRTSQSDLFVLQNVFLRGFYGSACGWVSGECRTIVDLGANTGQASLYLQSAFPDATIVCVEPIAENVAILSANASRHSWIVAPFAIAPYDGRVDMGVSTWWGSASMIRTVTDQRQSKDNRFEHSGQLPDRSIECISMGEILRTQGIEVVDLLKVDIEGAEERLFCENSGWLSRVRCIALEVHEKYVDRDRIEEALTSAGFQLKEAGHCRVYVNQHLVEPQGEARG